MIDFGLACKLSDDGVVNSFKVGSPLNRAPELTCPNQSAKIDYTAKVDVYALGLLYLEMLTGEPPFWAWKHSADKTKRLVNDAELYKQQEAQILKIPKVTQLSFFG